MGKLRWEQFVVQLAIAAIAVASTTACEAVLAVDSVLPEKTGWDYWQPSTVFVQANAKQIQILLSFDPEKHCQASGW